jgi:hypothetical protein
MSASIKTLLFALSNFLLGWKKKITPRLIDTSDDPNLFQHLFLLLKISYYNIATMRFHKIQLI